ncbi:DNA repair protein rad51c [Pleodorina starrii]|uniref:DNA repair protein RAD51 homolog 3 n=1 Tax=Pleodorina starrii TaxID=330485 RepID=A0A9W6BJ97_9CHLO|nr:DNA repair protein rad51c [Pleodorina starrii]GLC53246.1 DNA repair protein rad51c [Pleodorina starrii]GLC68119.1 DNA repair protein rad51c [Pleodorina starrii]
MSSRLEVVALPLPPHLRSKLLAAGFTNASELERCGGPVALARETGLTPEEAHEVLQLLLMMGDRPPGGPGAGGGGGGGGGDWRAGTVSAAALLEAHLASPRIVTMCRELDELLGGGVATGQVTEFCGVPGVGKTQLGMQLAVNVQIPAALAGAQGQAVYVDTEGSFMVERCADIAEGAVRHVTAMAEKQAAVGRPALAEALRSGAVAFDTASLLRGIYYFRIHDYTEQLALVNMLPRFLQQYPQVRLVVFDSVTFHFRQDFSDMAQRTRIITAMAQQLITAAQTYGVAVVLMNQVTTKVLEDGSSKLVPALGESWGHAASTRVMLHWGSHDNERHAQLFKSPHLPPGDVAFAVTADGVRGLPRTARAAAGGAAR